MNSIFSTFHNHFHTLVCSPIYLFIYSSPFLLISLSVDFRLCFGLFTSNKQYHIPLPLFWYLTCRGDIPIFFLWHRHLHWRWWRYPFHQWTKSRSGNRDCAGSLPNMLFISPHISNALLHLHPTRRSSRGHLFLSGLFSCWWSPLPLWVCCQSRFPCFATGWYMHPCSCRPGRESHPQSNLLVWKKWLWALRSFKEQLWRFCHLLQDQSACRQKRTDWPEWSGGIDRKWASGCFPVKIPDELCYH